LVRALYTGDESLYTRYISQYDDREYIMTNGHIAFARIAESRQRAAGSGFPSQATLDKIADQTITGGFKIARSNMCPGCFTARPVNGLCGCEE
jgi:hypothetical protein